MILFNYGSSIMNYTEEGPICDLVPPLVLKFAPKDKGSKFI